MSHTEQTLTVVRDVFEAFQAHDLERFRALLSDDVVLRDPSTRQTRSGPDAVAAAIEATLEAFPDLSPNVENLFANGEQAVAEVVRTGTNTGPLDLPGGPVPPTGREVRLPECIVLQVREGKVRSMTVYVDRLHVMEELGLSPSSPDEAASPEAASSPEAA